VEHCFNRAFFDAAGYMRRAGNPSGRRVIIVITGLTTGFECSGPSNEDARLAILESGSVVCGVVPTSAGQRIESGLMRAVTGIGGLFKVRTSSLKQLAEETGGEIVSEKADRLVSAFGTLVEHLRTRYTIGFVSTNTKKDGSYRKLRLDVWPFARKAGEKLVVRTRRGYVARLRAGEVREPALPRR
jgi:VWFA-related protein